MATKPATAALSMFLVAALAGCASASGAAERAVGDARPPASATATTSHTVTPEVAAPPVRSSPAASPERSSTRVPRRHARISIPSIGVRALRVVAYTGRADDLPGTRIQNRGLAASPRGPRGGVGPGQVGNLIITAHRTSAGGPFRRLPSLREGAHVLVSSAGLTYDYEVTGTMTVSFRSARDLARQSAPVPGHPGRPATRPMITLSTCATPEDHARGNYWADEFGNPEHRIDKVGVLVATRPS